MPSWIRPWALRLLIGAGALVVLGLLWVAVTAYLASRAADALQADLHKLKSTVESGQLENTTPLTDDISSHASRAHELTTGPAWWIGAHIPYFGRPLRVVRGAAAAGDSISHQTVPVLARLIDELAPSKLRTAGNTINLQPLAAAEPQLVSTGAALDRVDAQLRKLPAHTWLAPVDRGRRNLVNELSSIDQYVGYADRAAKILPTMLGGSTPKTYFVGLQNEAEARGAGGLPGAFAIAVADHGKVTFTSFESDTVLEPHPGGGLEPTGLDFGPAYDAAWGASEPTSVFNNSDLSPNFPYAAQIWAAMWEKVSGQHVDGAVSLDPTALGYFLKVTGPTPLPDGSLVSSDNVVSLTEKDLYARFSDETARKDYLVALIHAVDDKVTSGAGGARNLVAAAAKAAGQHRLLVWSADPSDEAVLSQITLGGVVPTDASPFSGLIINNVTGGKLEYYLQRAVTWAPESCGATRNVTVTISLTNTAPAAGLPAYVTIRSDQRDYAVKPGDDRVLVDYMATDGAQLISVTHNGSPTTMNTQSEEGHPMFRLNLELPQGKTQTLVLTLREPNDGKAPTVWIQPGVHDIKTTVDNRCH